MTAGERLARFLSKIKQTPQCWLWTGARLRTGYGQVNGGRDADGYAVTLHAHVVMWRLTHPGENLGELEVMHTCHTPHCVNPDHLIIGTHADNIAQGKARGSYAKPRSVSRELVRALVQQCLTGPRGTVARLADEHGVQYQTLSVAVNRERRRLRDAQHHEQAA
jgi:hypothetical protein